MKTVIGLFDTVHEAEGAVTALEGHNYARNDISIVANTAAAPTGDAREARKEAMTEGAKTGAGSGAVAGTAIGGVVGLLAGLGTIVIPGIGPILAAGPLLATLTGAGVGAAAGAAVGSLVGALTNIGVPEDDAHVFAEGVRRGGTLVMVRAEDSAAEKIAEILTDKGAVDVDERRGYYEQSGFTGHAPDASPYTAEQISRERDAHIEAAQTNPRGDRGRVLGQSEVRLPVVEEELKVGKRTVEGGRVRVYSHVTETPVQEQIELREERVTVDRHAVDRPVDAGDAAAFREKSFELGEYREEAVVNKEARVVEEVVVGREALEHTETIQDTVRRSDVEVERIAADPEVRRTPPPPPKTGR